MKRSVLIAGIGGASLGTEIFKSLKSSGNYKIYGVDISPYAYGLYDKGFEKTYLVEERDYVNNILNISKDEKIEIIIPAAEKTLLLLSKSKDLFEENSIKLAINAEDVIARCTDKLETFKFLEENQILCPKTRLIKSKDDLDDFNYPIILKPSSGSGGSVFVSIVGNKKEAKITFDNLKEKGLKIIGQEYIPIDEGEFSICVLSLPDGEIYGSIAFKKVFPSKLSYVVKYDDKIICSPYSQGFFDDFLDIRKQAEIIAKKIGNKGPLNIQGRLKDGKLYPFEINPRFSGSNYLRTMAGFNTVDIFLQFILNNKKIPNNKLKKGYYFRSLSEKFVKFEDIKNGKMDK